MYGASKNMPKPPRKTVLVASRLVSKTYPWAEAGPELLVDIGAIDPRNRDSIRRGWIEGSQIVILAVDRAAVVIANP